MSIGDEMQAIAIQHSTIAGKIRALAAAGYARADIARALGRSYQQVRNVLQQDAVLGRAAALPAPSAVQGVEQNPTTYAAEKDDEFRAKYPPTIRLALDKEGSVALPRSLIEQMRWHPGGVIIAEMRDDGLYLLSSPASGRRVQEKVRDLLPASAFKENWSDSLIADRRREAAAEEDED
jgi:hypothetical protein